MDHRKWSIGFSIPAMCNTNDARRRIRSLFKEKLSIRPGPRGMFIGPLFMIWSGIDLTRDFELVAVIRRDEWHSRVDGITGSAIGTLIILCVPIAIFCWAGWGLWSGELYAMGAVPLLVISGVTSALIGWLLLRSDPMKNPYVRLLHAQLAKGSASPASTESTQVILPISARVARGMEMDISGERSSGPATLEQLQEAFDAVDVGAERFIILSPSDDEFMQSAHDGIGYVVEWRRREDEGLRSAVKTGAPEDALQLAEAKSILAAYLHGATHFPGIEWK